MGTEVYSRRALCSESRRGTGGTVFGQSGPETFPKEPVAAPARPELECILVMPAVSFAPASPAKVSQLVRAVAEQKSSEKHRVLFVVCGNCAKHIAFWSRVLVAGFGGCFSCCFGRSALFLLLRGVWGRVCLGSPSAANPHTGQPSHHRGIVDPPHIVAMLTAM